MILKSPFAASQPDIASPVIPASHRSPSSSRQSEVLSNSNGNSNGQAHLGPEQTTNFGWVCLALCLNSLFSFPPIPLGKCRFRYAVQRPLHHPTGKGGVCCVRFNVLSRPIKHARHRAKHKWCLCLKPNQTTWRPLLGNIFRKSFSLCGCCVKIFVAFSKRESRERERKSA